MARVTIGDIERERPELSDKEAEQITGGGFVIEERTSSHGVIRSISEKYTLFNADGIPVR